MTASIAINAAGMDLVEARLKAVGFEAIRRIARPTRQLVVDPPSGSEIKIDVKAKSGPMPAGGDGKDSLDWWLKDEADSDFVAAVDLSSGSVWLFRTPEFREFAQQHTPAGEAHLYMWVDPTVKPRNGYPRNLVSDFDDYLIDRRIGALRQETPKSRSAGSWSDDELSAAVAAYALMLQHQRDGVPYSKADVNRRLRRGILVGRTRASVEYRMQNISAVLDSLGLDRVSGYLPAGNVGTSVSARIQRLLEAHGAYRGTSLEPTFDLGTFEDRVRRLRTRAGTLAPAGAVVPRSRTGQVTEYERDPKVKAWVLHNSGGTCELCGRQGPFVGTDGSRFLELHHVVPLSEGGPDTTENAVALCPNCHRHVHYGEDRTERTEVLYRRLSRLRRVAPDGDAGVA